MDALRDPLGQDCDGRFRERSVGQLAEQPCCFSGGKPASILDQSVRIVDAQGRIVHVDGEVPRPADLVRTCDLGSSIEDEVGGYDDKSGLLGQLSACTLERGLVVLNPAARDVPVGPAPTGVLLADQYNATLVGCEDPGVSRVVARRRHRIIQPQPMHADRETRVHSRRNGAPLPSAVRSRMGDPGDRRMPARPGPDVGREHRIEAGIAWPGVVGYLVGLRRVARGDSYLHE